MITVLFVLFLLGAIAVPGIWVRQVLQRYSEPDDRYRGRCSGAEIARHLLDSYDLHGVAVEITPAGDHYDPEARAVRLVEDKYYCASCILDRIELPDYFASPMKDDNHVNVYPRPPRQNPYVKPDIGSIRRHCLEHVIDVNEGDLRRVLRAYFNHYPSCRTHLSLNKDPPKPRAVDPEALGDIVALPQVGGAHHRCTRAAA